MPIDFTPDPVQAPTAGAAVLPIATEDFLNAPDAPPAIPAPDTTGWSVVPATVRDERSFTAEDYDEASAAFKREGNEELAAQAAVRAAQMRLWLLTQQADAHN